MRSDFQQAKKALIFSIYYPRHLKILSDASNFYKQPCRHGATNCAFAGVSCSFALIYHQKQAGKTRFTF